MPYSRRLVILAKSRKRGRICIAGIDMDARNWIRPVKNTPFTSNELCNLSNHTDPIKILDIIEMTFIAETPEDHQPENEFVDMNVEWRYLGEFPIEDLENLAEENPYDLVDAVRYKSISANDIAGLDLQNSLQLIRITNSSEARIIYQYNSFQSLYKPRLTFNHRGIHYILPITDITFPDLNSRRDPAILRNAWITIGIGENYKGDHYLLVVMLKDIESN